MGRARVTSTRLRAGLALGLTLGAVLLELVALRLTLAPGERVAALLAHLSAAVLTGTATREMADKARAREGSFWVGFSTALLFFPFGVLGSLILGRAWSTVRSRPVVSSWKARREAASEAARERRRKMQSCGPDVDPIVDALEDRDSNVRVAAVDALRGQISARAVRTLFAARENEVFEVRVRALEAIERIQREFVERIRAAEAEVRDAAAAEARATAEKALARLLLQWAELGLEDPARVRVDLERARSAATGALSRSPQDSDAELLAAEAASHLGAKEEAIVRCRRALATSEDAGEARRILAEALFRARRFEELARVCADERARAPEAHDAPHRSAVELWAWKEAM